MFPDHSQLCHLTLYLVSPSVQAVVYSHGPGEDPVWDKGSTDGRRTELLHQDLEEQQPELMCWRRHTRTSPTVRFLFWGDRPGWYSLWGGKLYQTLCNRKQGCSCVIPTSSPLFFYSSCLLPFVALVNMPQSESVCLLEGSSARQQVLRPSCQNAPLYKASVTESEAVSHRSVCFSHPPSVL